MLSTFTSADLQIMRRTAKSPMTASTPSV